MHPTHHGYSIDLTRLYQDYPGTDYEKASAIAKQGFTKAFISALFELRAQNVIELRCDRRLKIASYESSSSENINTEPNVEQEIPEGLTKILNVSSSHLRVQDWEILGSYTFDEEGQSPENLSRMVQVDSIEDGYVIQVSRLPVFRTHKNADFFHSIRVRNGLYEVLAREGFSDEFAALYVHAAENHATLLGLSSSYEPHPGHPIFSSETDEELSSDYKPIGL